MFCSGLSKPADADGLARLQAALHFWRRVSLGAIVRIDDAALMLI